MFDILHMQTYYNYEKKVLTVMVNNFTNINKRNDRLWSPLIFSDWTQEGTMAYDYENPGPRLGHVAGLNKFIGSHL
jgi:hypothetical protein